MRSQKYTKSERLESRCTKEQKRMVEYAAKLCGSSITDFTINTLMEKANQVIRQQNTLEWSINDQLAFAKALLEPQAPNQALREAKNRYQKEVKS
jgi:uncharacterized protein (DUF1778 family)